MALKPRNAIAFVLGVCAAGPALGAIGGAGGRPHRLERLRRERPEGVLHRLAAEDLGRPARRPAGRGAARRHPAVRRLPPRRERVERGELHRRLPVPGGQHGDARGRRRTASRSGPGSGDFGRVGLDRPRRRRPRGGGDAPRRRPPRSPAPRRAAPPPRTPSRSRASPPRSRTPRRAAAEPPRAASGDFGREWLCRASPPPVARVPAPMNATPRSSPTSSTLPRRPAGGARPNLVGMTRGRARARRSPGPARPRRRSAMRVGQIWQWLYHRGARDFAAMTNLARAYRESLADALRDRAARDRHPAGLGRRHPQVPAAHRRRARDRDRLHPRGGPRHALRLLARSAAPSPARSATPAPSGWCAT